ncbi:MAG TPA: hypothetical protein VF837_02790 [Patescibacteria group bacterium]
MEEKVLFQWQAMDRPNKTWSKDFYSTVIVLAFLVSVILFFIEGLLPVILVWAVVFMMWSMNRLPAKEVEYALTSWGIRTNEGTYRWEEMNYFWFEDKWGSRLLRVSINKIPWQIIFVVNKKDEDEIKKIMIQYVAFQVPKPSWSDNVVKWLGEKIPLE